MRLPDFAAEGATRGFNIDLFREHLEEASFLYEQRRKLYDDPEVTWLGIGEFELRLKAHINALVSGEDVALEICERQAREGEPGELYAAVCVFCQLGRRESVSEVLRRLDTDNAVRSQAVSDAMKDEMPTEWTEALAAGVARGHEKLIPIVAHCVGYRRLAGQDAVAKLVERVSEKGLAQVIWALGRIGGDAVVSQVSGYVGHEDAAVRTNAVMALLRQGDERAIAACRTRALRGDAAMCLPLAVCGGRSDAASLQKAVLTQAVTPELVIALGVLGELGAVRLLVDRLTDEGLGAAAATALQLITGADLREEAFIPEVVEEDELFDDERQVYRETGEAPKHVDGRPFGVNVKRVSQSQHDWRHWLEEHKMQFDASQRYRLGKPFSLSTLVDTLVSPSFGRQVRSMAYEELVIRYGIDIPFETEMRVGQQKRQINAIARLCRSRESSFRPGQWYFAGR